MEPDTRFFLAFGIALLIALPASAQTCPLIPVANCLIAERSELMLRNDPIDTKDRLVWKWKKGEPVANLMSFDDPTAATDYLWCTYTGAVPVLRAGGAIEIPPSATRWLPTPKGYKYKDKDAVEDGVTVATLRGDPLPSRSSASVKGKGANLPDPALGFVNGDFPLVIQFINSDNNFCLESTFLFIDIVKNEMTKFKVKNQ